MPTEKLYTKIKFQRLKQFRWREAAVISLNGFSPESSGRWGDDMVSNSLGILNSNSLGLCI